MQRRVKSVLAASVVTIVVGALALFSPWIYALGAGTLWDRAEPEVHLLPEGFTGPVVILLSDSAAAVPEREHGARLFRISSSGVVRSRFPVKDGWGRPDYFYVDRAGRRTRIVSGTPCDLALANDPVQACLLGHTRFGDLPDRPYEAYVVGRRSDQKKWEWQAEYFVDSAVYGRRPVGVPSNER